MNSKAKIFSCLLSLFFFNNSIWAQQAHDTISLKDALLKGGNFIIETVADENHTLVINEILSSNATINQDEEGDFDDWFEIYNYGDNALNLKDYYFSDNKNNPLKWEIESEDDYSLQPGDFIIIWTDDETEQGDLHTNFKLSSNGEFIGVYTKDEILIDGIEFESQNTDISYGRFPDGGLNFHYFLTPTPTSANINHITQGTLQMPTSNIKGGIYNQSLSLELATYENDCELYYTLDYTEPTKQSIRYSSPINIDETSVIRVRSFKEDFVSSQVLSLSIIITEELYENPIISIVTDDEYLHGSQGILDGASTIEIPANMEYFENGKTIYSSGMGVKLHSPKGNKQYSMRFYARGRYGNSWFEHPFFGDNSVGKFKRLIIRNSGNDCVQIKDGNSHFRDQLIHRIANSYTNKAIISESKPVNIFINGEFFGLYNLRERIDEYFIETHYPDLSDYDLLERAFGFGSNRNAIEGDWEDWDEILNLVDIENDMSIDEDYYEALELIDVENFTDYWLTEIIIGNYDWLSNNIKFIVPDDEKCQWIYWDTDHGIGYKYSNYGLPTWNTLEWSLTFSDRAWPEGQNNRIARNLLKNKNYKEFFLRRLCYLLNVSYREDNIHPALDSMKQLYANDIYRHTQKWGNDMSSWNDNIENIKNYFTNRPGNVFEHATSFFELNEPVNVQIKTEPENGGFIYFDKNKDPLTTFNGKLFTEYEYQINAVPLPGFDFIGWENVENTSAEIKTSFTKETNIKALFKIDSDYESLYLSEIYFNSSNQFSCGDWLELTNFSVSEKDISGCKIYQNDKLIYEFGDNAILKPSEYIVLAKEPAKFEQVYFEDKNLIGELLDNLQGNSIISITNKDGKELRALSYQMGENDWPDIPFNGYSYELLAFNNNSENPNSWQLSNNRFGTPGLGKTNLFLFNKPFGSNDTVVIKNSPKYNLQEEYFHFNDIDDHDFAAVQIHSISGKTQLLWNGSTCIPNEIYSPDKFSVFANGFEGDETSIVYSLIDNSGDESSSFELIITDSLNHETFTPNINTYPIPANNFIIIDIDGFRQSKMNIHLYNYKGELVLSEQNIDADSSYEIDVANLTTGTFIISVDYNKKTTTKKVIIIK